ncbi:aminodeoxychorismate lyase [Thalassotalea fonticola]|uniref:Aminodeoxychorismate lyase n=1 Tax=Thalassotalea fonticola TaxID=3065649 RepID=A0ABZ0GQ95_9GAMM|nr:aminodeoxychorismate lyase [Colwelliaceae bacterium S1-1]
MLYSSVNFKQCNNVDIKDRSIAFGDGVFTTAKVVDGEVEHLSGHIQRLKQGCRKLNITEPDFQQVSSEMIKAAKTHLLATVKVVVSAGESSRGYARDANQQPTVMVTSAAFPKHYLGWQSNGLTLGLSSIKLGRNPILAGIKHLNRLEQVLIRGELENLNVDEVVVCDFENYIIECNTANLFWYRAGKWYTPILSMAGVNGLIRQKLMALLPNVVECHAKVEELDMAESMLICNCLLSVVAAKSYLGKSLKIDHDLLTKLQQQLKEFD